MTDAPDHLRSTTPPQNAEVSAWISSLEGISRLTDEYLEKVETLHQRVSTSRVSSASLDTVYGEIESRLGELCSVEERLRLGTRLL